jgi:hypothetical protein
MFDQSFWKEVLSDLFAAVIFAGLTFSFGLLFYRRRKERINKKLTDYLLRVIETVEAQRKKK